MAAYKAGFASPWYFRRHLFRDARTLVEKALLPVLGGIILFALFLYAAKTYYAADYGNTSFFGVGGVFVLGIGSILLGVVLMIIWNIVAPAFFTGRTMDSDVVVVHTGEALHVGHTGWARMTTTADPRRPDGRSTHPSVRNPPYHVYPTTDSVAAAGPVRENRHRG